MYSAATVYHYQTGAIMLLSFAATLIESCILGSLDPITSLNLYSDHFQLCQLEMRTCRVLRPVPFYWMSGPPSSAFWYTIWMGLTLPTKVFILSSNSIRYNYVWKNQLNVGWRQTSIKFSEIFLDNFFCDRAEICYDVCFISFLVSFLQLLSRIGSRS